jgi:hypothetical protein
MSYSDQAGSTFFYYVTFTPPANLANGRALKKTYYTNFYIQTTDRFGGTSRGRAPLGAGQILQYC